MTSLQRYVSRELTHFVGRSKTPKEQYLLLVKILSSGLLLSHPFSENIQGNLAVKLDAKVSDNEMFNIQAICFCDIPTADLSIHMSKYSKFGISFEKEYLIKKGVNPVFYVANDSIVLSVPFDTPLRGAHFDKMIRIQNSLFFKTLQAFMKASSQPGVPEEYVELKGALDFLNFEIFSYIKCFDASLPDNDPRNYYMEREWRMTGNLKFQLKDVKSVILPQSFSKRFRLDFPQYVGQVVFPDKLNI